jgi:hypothetical protein
MRFHVTYKMPGYESTLVERFATQDEADRRYDELVQNGDVHELAQPVDTEAALIAQAAPSVQVTITVTQPAIDDQDQ